MSIKLKTILLATIILLLSISVRISSSQTSTTSESVCDGSISLTFSPNHGFAGDTITASVGNLIGEGCIDKRVYIKESSCQGLQYCSCLPSQMTGGMYGCICTFRAPPTPYISGTEPSRESTFTYYACVDLDDNSVYDEALGEQTHMDLLVYSRYAPLGMATESIIIIISLGVLLVIIIFVFRMSFRRR